LGVCSSMIRVGGQTRLINHPGDPTDFDTSGIFG
jgi:hypothetical protein